MTIIDADKFLAYLIFSKHIDGLNCGEVKKEIEMCKVDVLDKIIAENSVKTDGDLISRESVITMLQKICNAVDDGEGFQLNEWVEYAKNIPSAEKTAEWIPVKKQKPEDYEEVIATVRYDYKNKQEYEVVTGVRYSKEDGWEWAYEAGSDYWESIDGVVAWQPLPKPYEVKR